MAFWGVEIKPGKPFTLSSHNGFIGRLRISQATLGSSVSSISNKSCCVQCNVGKKSPVLLCSLLPDKVESLHLELEFQESHDVTFSVIGPRSVHLTGYVLAKPHHLSLPNDDDSESFGEDIGDADTEASDEDVSDDDTYQGSFIDDGEPQYSSPSEDFEEAILAKKKANTKKGSRKRLKKTYELSDSEGDCVPSSRIRSRKCVQIVDSDDDDHKFLSSLCGNVKDCDASKRKVDAVAGQATIDQPSEDVIRTKNKLHNVTGRATSDDQADDSKAMTKKLDIPAEQATDDCHKTDGCLSTTDKKVKRKKVDDVVCQETDGCQSDDRKSKKRKKVDNVAEQPVGDGGSDKKAEKKKRKNKKSLVEIKKSSSEVKNEATALVENGEMTTEVCSRSTSDGLVIEELDIGKQDGKVASSGRKVTVHYTGRLKEQGHVFYSTVGKSPLKFRLGKDAALDGLHLGIDGMRAGGKRRLVIPPELGYGSKGGDGVPPNAWLVMEVELLRVR